MSKIDDQKILEELKKEISGYEYLRYEEACNIYKVYKDTKDLSLKEILRNKLINGTMKVVVEHIENNKYALLTNRLYDMGDIINSAIKAWIDTLEEGALLKNNSYSSILFKTTYGNKLNAALGIDAGTLNNNGKISLVDFTMLLTHYLKSIRENGNYSFTNFKSDIENMAIANKLQGAIYTYNQSKDIYYFFNKMLEQLEATPEEFEIAKTQLENVKNILISVGQVESLDALQENEELEPEYSIDFEEDLDREFIIKEVREELENNNNLTDSQKQVLILRFGIYDGKPRTLEEVGAILCCTRERVRQIEARALLQLRYNSNFTNKFSGVNL